MATSAVGHSVPPSDKLRSELHKRYQDAYIHARTINGLGQLIKVVSVLVGIIFAVLGVLGGTARDGSPILVVMAVGIGIAIGGSGFIAGVVIAASGQMLKAQLDTAVYTSTFLTDAERASIMSLPIIASASASGASRATRNCSSCGAACIEGTRFCEKCGKALT